MKRFTPIVLAALAIGIVGCNNDAARTPTAPIRSPARSVINDDAGDACSFVLHDQTGAERQTLFSGDVLAALVTDYWQAVVENCPVGQPNLTDADLAVAREAMLRYIQRTIDLLHHGDVTNPADNDPPTPFASKEAALVDHWNTMFAFVGYARPNLPPLVLLPGGVAGVIFQNTPGRELKIPSAAAMTVPVQIDGDTRGHLFTIYPLDGACLGGANELAQTGPCFQFSANPKVDPKFDPKVKVGICEPVAAGAPIPGAIPALGHEDKGQVNIAAPVGIYPTDCLDLGTEASAGSWTGGFGDLALKLASVARKAVGITPAYAAHGGLGGVSEEFSTFGAVDLLLFKATFTNDAPLKDPPGPPEVGSWSMLINKPSTIRVDKKIGDLLNKPVILDYKEMKCGGCVGLYLRGIIRGGSTEANGKYQITWWSLSEGPDEDAAAFVVRDSQLRELARVTYASTKKPKADVLQYNGNNVGFWKKSDKQRFDLFVDLDGKTTTLQVNGVTVASNVPFVNNAVANLASIGAEFAGDTKKVGWDDITIVRRPD